MIYLYGTLHLIPTHAHVLTYPPFSSLRVHLLLLLFSLLGTEIVTAMELMITPAPTIYKPKMLWTGKQVVSSLLKHMCRPPLPQLNLGKECLLDHPSMPLSIVPSFPLFHFSFFIFVLFCFIDTALLPRGSQYIKANCGYLFLSFLYLFPPFVFHVF